MMEGWSLRIEIGGEASHADMLRLFEEAAESGLMVTSRYVHAKDYVDNASRRLRPEDLQSVTCCSATLSFSATYFNADEFEQLEDTCREIGLPYVRTVDGDDGSDGFALWWMPGMDGTERCDVNSQEEPIVTVSDVVEAKAAGTLDDLIARSSVPTIPPFVIRT